MMDAYAVNVVPGVGGVVRWPSGVVVAGGSASESLDLIAALQASVGLEPTSGALIDALRNEGPLGGVPANLAAAVTTPDGLRIFVCGAMQVRTESNELIAGPELVERDLPGDAALWLGAGDPPSSPGHRVLDLRLGVVTGQGVVLHRPAVLSAAETPPVAPVYPARVRSDDGPQAGSPQEGHLPEDQRSEGLPSAAPRGAPPAPSLPPPAPPDAAATDPEPVLRPFEAIDWGADQGGAAAAAETRMPLEVLGEPSEGRNDEGAQAADGYRVYGINCSRGHFNNPRAGYCQVCGISMVHLTHRLEQGIRPTLGFVVFADGATYAVDRPYLIGRSPQPSDASGLTPLPTQDATQSVSREHGELRLLDWDVAYVDLGSTNGSYLWNQVAGRWDPIQPNVPVTLASGTTVSVGRMTFIFEGASKPVGA